MRDVFYSDVSAAARVLLSVPLERRTEVCLGMMQEAEVADRFLRRLGKMHPHWGNGTLRSAALRRYPVGEPSFRDPDYCSCFQMVLHHLHKDR